MVPKASSTRLFDEISTPSINRPTNLYVGNRVNNEPNIPMHRANDEQIGMLMKTFCWEIETLTWFGKTTCDVGLTNTNGCWACDPWPVAKANICAWPVPPKADGLASIRICGVEDLDIFCGDDDDKVLDAVVTEFGCTDTWLATWAAWSWRQIKNHY